MLESAIIHHQQHVGLQKLSALAGMLQSSLGPNKRYKFIQDDTSGESALVCSCFHIIQNLDPTCAVGQLVYETVHAQQNVYHTGSGCLLFLAGAWSRASLDCLHRGISITHIISAMSEGMDICMDVCKKFSVSIQDLATMPLERRAAASDGLVLPLSKTPITEACTSFCSLQERLKLDHKTLSISGQSKIKLSRHFCETKSEFVPKVQQSHPPGLSDIAHIAEALSHSCDKVMELAVKAIQAQSENNQQDSSYPMFDITKVVTCVLPGLPEDHACIVQGFVVLLSDEQASVAHHLKEQPLKVALMNGDLSHTYRHLGFKRPAGVRVRHQLDLSSSSKEDEWVEKVMKLLLNLKVDLILTTGHACESMIHHCYRHRILVVEKANSSVLKTFANSTGAVPVTYVTQLSEHCLGSGVEAAIWRDLSSFERKSLTAVRIFTGRTTELVTVILTSCIYAKLQALEDQFWACAYRLHHALKDGALLPGAGGTEMLCVHHLQKQAECHREDTSVKETKTGTAANLYRGVVLQLMAEGFIDYITAVMVNTGRFSKVKARTIVSQQLQNCNGHQDIAAKFSQLVLESEKEAAAVSSTIKPEATPAVKIYDNLSVKQEAWRKALDLVFLVLQSDAEVITGVGLKGEENLMLL